MSREWARTLLADAALREPVAALLKELPGEIHADHLAAYTPEVRKVIRRCRRLPRAGGRLSCDLSWLGVSVAPLAEADWQALSAGGAARLALIPRKQLAELTLFAGGLVCRREVARAIRRDDVALLRETLGDTAYHFILRRSPFLDVPALAVPESAELIERIRLSGLTALAACASLLTPGLLGRLTLKLPGRFGDARARAEGADASGLWDWTKRIVIREALPAWTAIFN